MGQFFEELKRRNVIKILAAVCSDNPYAPAWQPAEETCAQYFSAENN